MASFGEYSLAGMMEQCKSCTRRSESLQLGPLTMKDPLWMEMEIGNLVAGGPGKAIGILGLADHHPAEIMHYDVLRDCGCSKAVALPF